MANHSSLQTVPVSQSKYEDEVNIQCVQSSEFVLGKQTNFNGPVTLINCVNSQEEGDPEIKNEHKNEKIIIRDKVSSPSEPTSGEKKDKGAWKIFQERVLEKLKKIPKVPVFLCCGLMITTAIALTAFIVLASTATGDEEGIIMGSHLFYTKKSWGGAPPKSTVEMKLPIPYAVVSHTVTPQCFQLKSCTPLIQNMQNYHMSIEFADIGYNFLVDSSGNIYEGRGWNIRNVKGGFVNGRNIDIALIGDYSETAYPTENIMEGLKDLLEFGFESEVLSVNYSLIAANSTYSTLSPGINVYNIIKNWPHFDPDPVSHIKEYEV